MKGSAKSKVVTSGRLTGGVKGQLCRRRVTPDPGPACPEPAYSLYSTSTQPEEQVSSLHKGLDRCAALLTDILQAEPAGLPRAVKGVAARPTPQSSFGKKTIRNTKTYQRGRQPVQPVPGTTTRAVKLHPPKNQTFIPPPENQTTIPPPKNQTFIPPPVNQTSIPPPVNQTSIPPPVNQTSIPPPVNQTSIPPPKNQTTIPPPKNQTSIPPPVNQTSIPPPVNQTSIPPAQKQCDGDSEEEEFVPVRDLAVRQSGTLKKSSMQLDEVLQDSHSREDCSAETDVEVKTVQYLLGELKALIAGQGSVAERLLSRLEQTVSSALMGAGSSNIWTEPEPLSLHSQNTQLHRTPNQQLQQSGAADPCQKLQLLRYSQVLPLQEELAQLRKALKDTQSRLTDREAENALIQADLEATRSRLLHSEREKRELSSLAQRRLEDIGNLNRILQGHDSSKRPPGVDGSVSDTEQRFDQLRPDPAEPPSDRIAQFLMSLGQLEPTPTEQGVPSRVQGGRPSRWDVESVWSDRSARSGATFDTRDEVAFRKGLAALDASIANLQRTIHLDLGR
ncbi:uncharacterized protein [Clinocottus analis]|uniref:uncharacterized protein isoform X2 n=1 Tax=Clinocottus analis TaxID=304258 RepID=UPI0035BEE806